MTREQILEIYNQGPEAVVKLVTNLLKIINELKVTVAEQGTRITKLEQQLAKDSHNSSKPPSTDGFRKQPKSLRQKGNKKSGGQKGHKGSTLTMIKNPDKILRLPLDDCHKCGDSLKDVKKTIEKHQVFDLPELKIKVTEYQAECATCLSCKTNNKASFPVDASRKTQYGSKFRAMLVYLNQYQLIPYNRTREFMQDIFNINISEGTLYNTIKSCYNKTESVEEIIKNQIINSFAVGFDESGAYCKGKRHWYHVARTENLTFFGVHEKRGRTAMNFFGILPNFKGAALHDFYRSYFCYPGEHFLCNAHLLRELIFELEEKSQKWAKSLIKLLTESNKEVAVRKKQGRKSVSKVFYAKKNKTFDAIIKKGLNLNPRQPGRPNQRGRPAQSSAHNLLVRLRDFKKSYLEFMNDFRIPFDNNGSERDIRMLKVQQKISCCFRSNEGAAYFARIRGYISTSRKNGINILDALTGVFTGSPYIPVATT